MNFYLPRQLGSLVVLTLLLTGCGAAADDEVAAGPGMTDLAPTFDARPAEGSSASPTKQARKQSDTPRAGAGTKQAATRPTRKPQQTEPQQTVTATKPTKGTRDGTSAPGGAVAAPSGPVRVSDPSGDLGRGLEGSPAHADIVAVQVDRSGGTVTVRTTFAAAVPTKQTDNKGMNVASFYDVDDNGVIDYEVWASLADNGWGTGHLDRRQEKASFGPSTGIEVTVEGATLVTRFPVDRIGGAEVFRWSAASEWGSYESMAASTTARDYAPDEGSVDYPG
jgi:hypothetical protein